MNAYSVDRLEDIRRVLDRREKAAFSEYATLSSQARFRSGSRVKQYRQLFAGDTDRILHSRGYTRYIDKPQVFSFTANDHITHRSLHVQLVSKIGRTIGRFLGLNEDLIEAISLGHDLGHSPFGHDGERILSRLCRDRGIGHFVHSVQSVHLLEHLEKKGKGLSLSLQVLDGVLCHDGEMHNQRLVPDVGKDFARLDQECGQKKADPKTPLFPMTMEGCVMRMSDVIAYIGRDIEDGITLGLIRRDQIPRECSDVLGRYNNEIVDKLVSDVIRSSYGQGVVQMSPEVSEALRRLKAFNLESIYFSPMFEKHLGLIEAGFVELFERLEADLVRGNEGSLIFTDFLRDMTPAYRETLRPAEIVRDFIAGMTDKYFLSFFPKERTPNFVRRVQYGSLATG